MESQRKIECSNKLEEAFWEYIGECNSEVEAVGKQIDDVALEDLWENFKTLVRDHYKDTYNVVMGVVVE